MALNIYEELDLTSSGDNVDEGSLKCKNNWESWDTELHNARDGELTLIAKIDTLAPATGYYRRSAFTYVDADTLTVGAGSYDVNGTLAKITADITTTAHGVTGADWAYLYIDYSGIPSDGVLLQATIIWSITEPTWSDSLLGWYNGNDRCIFGVYVQVTTDDILEFFHNRSFIDFADEMAIETQAGLTTSWADMTAFTMPVFSRVAVASFLLEYGDGASFAVEYRTNGQTDTSGRTVGYATAAGANCFSVIDITTDSSYLIEVREGVNTTGSVTIKQIGWYLPEGI